MFPTSFGLRSQMILAVFDECLFDADRARPARPIHSRRGSGR
jgi:hypothetical protein